MDGSDQHGSEQAFWYERPVLITGIRGFIGRHLANRLQHLGAMIHGISRGETEAPSGVTIWKCDLSDVTATWDVVRQICPQIIFHLAGHVTTRWDRSLVIPSLQDTCNTTVHLLHAAAEVGTVVFIMVSTAEVSILPVQPRSSPYAVAKRCAEEFAELYRDSFGLDVRIARPTLVYGPGQSSEKLIPYVIDSLRNGVTPRLRNVRRRVDVLFVDDLVAALLRMAQCHTCGASWDIASGQVVTIGELAQRIADRLHVSIPAYLSDEPSDGKEADLVVDPYPAWRALEWRPVVDLSTGLDITATHSEAQANSVATDEARRLRQQILRLTRQYYHVAFCPQHTTCVSRVPVAGRSFDADELSLLVESSLDFWLTAGRFAARFERDFAATLGVRHAVLCNSGSSANLLAIAALTSPQLGDRRLRPGDEVITAAAGFPTTVNPIIQYGLIPVFVDIELGTYNVPIENIEAAISPRTRAIFLAHTLGNPFDVSTVQELCERHSLWFIEDNCDAVGSIYDGKYTGTFGDLATVSFYPAHHLTMGEGGCVLTNDGQLKMLVESFRDWGRACWCPPGKDNTCNRRHWQQLGQLPFGYDHKYTYSHVGYNLKLTDMQAAVGVAQLAKLPQFISARKYNWSLWRSAFEEWSHWFILPKATPRSEPSWFGFALTIKDTAPFSRRDLIQYLESHGIATRMLFGGNLTRQPAYQEVPYRICGSLTHTDIVTERSFWIGVYPGLTEEHIRYACDVFRAFLEQKTSVRVKKAS